MHNKFSITLFTGNENDRLTKKHTIGEDGEVKKESSPLFSSGSAKTLELENLDELASTIDGLKTNQCIATGVFDIPECRIVIKDRLDEDGVANGVRARSKKFMKQPSLGIILLDYDPNKYMTNDQICHSVNDVINKIKLVAPVFKKVGYIGRESASSGIYKTGGSPKKYNKGFHIYMLVKDIPLTDIKEYLEVKLWNEGYGYIDFARSGAMLPRTIIDLSVFSPERVIYEAHPVLGEGVSMVPKQWVKKSGEVLSGALTLSDSEKLQFREAIRAAKNDPKKIENAKAKETQFNDDQVLKCMEVNNISKEEAQQIVSGFQLNTEGGTLLPVDFVIDLGSKKITVKELLNSGSDYNELIIPDPIEGVDYGYNKAIFYYNNGLNPIIRSFAHGGQTYRFEGYSYDQRRNEMGKYAESNQEQFTEYAEETTQVISPTTVLPLSHQPLHVKNRELSDQKIIQPNQSLDWEESGQIPTYQKDPVETKAQNPSETETHNISDKKANQLLQAADVLESMFEKLADDAGALFEDEVINAFKVIREDNEAEFQRFKNLIKDVNKRASLTQLEQLTKVSRRRKDNNTLGNSHHSYATNMIEEFTIGGYKPVGFGDKLWYYDSDSGLWVGLDHNALKKRAAEKFDQLPFCRTNNDYASIATHLLSLIDAPDFFEKAPFGLATPEGFYRIEKNEVKKEPLRADHRQRIMLPVVPEKIETPLFNKFIFETFNSENEEEYRQQVDLLQEVIGVIILGQMNIYQKAILFYDQYGRAGKGVMTKIIEALVPENFTCSVSPFLWSDSYFLATLAGMKLNIVGELPQNKVIPCSNFKSVIGHDQIGARHTYGRPFNFRNEAAHIFSSNHLIKTDDFSDAFYDRWLIFKFPNSLEKTKRTRDEYLANNIIQAELPGVAQWALDGAVRRLGQKSFSSSIVHNEMMKKWRIYHNSLLGFIEDCCEVGDKAHTVRRAAFYDEYVKWCNEFGLRYHSKQEVKDRITSTASINVEWKIRDGIETFVGIRIKKFTNELESTITEI